MQSRLSVCAETERSSTGWVVLFFCLLYKETLFKFKVSIFHWTRLPREAVECPEIPDLPGHCDPG